MRRHISRDGNMFVTYPQRGGGPTFSRHSQAETDRELAFQYALERSQQPDFDVAGQGHRQHGGEEGPDGLEAMIAQWGVELHKNGQAGAFLFDLAKIKPSVGKDSFKKDLRRIAKEAKLSIDESVFEEIRSTDWDILTNEMDVAIETAALDGREFYLRDFVPESEPNPAPDPGDWWSYLTSYNGLGPSPPAPKKAIGDDGGVVHAYRAPYDDTLQPSAPPPEDVYGKPGADQPPRAPPNRPPVVAATQILSTAITELKGASALERIKLLEALQLDPNLQAMVKAGLLDWKELLMDNDGSVVAPDGTKPEKIVDEAKLKDLQSKLLKLGLQQQQATAVQIRQSERQRTTPGNKPGTGFFGNRAVYMPPQYLPGRLPNEENVVLV